MFVNNYLLIILGLTVTIFITIIIDLIVGLIFSFIFWGWFMSKKTYKKEEPK